MYFFYARYKPVNMPLTFWTLMEVIQSLLICLITVYTACKRFVILNRERRLPLIINQIQSWRQNVISITGNTLGSFSMKKEPCLDTLPRTREKRNTIYSVVLEYIILTVFVLSITLYQILYGILMVFTQLCAQVDLATRIEASLADSQSGNDF